MNGKDIRVTIRVREDVRDGIIEMAGAENRSVSNYIETLILHDMQRKKAPTQRPE